MNDPILEGMVAERAYSSIYSSQYGDAVSSAKANEAARRLGMPADIVEAALPDMLAEDRLRRRTVEMQRNQAYARMMANNQRLAAAAIDDDELPKVAQRVDNHRNTVEGRVQFMSPALVGMAASNLLGGLFGGTLQGITGIGRAVHENVPRMTALPWQLQAGVSALGLMRHGTPLAKSIDKSLSVETENRNLNDMLMGARSAGTSIAALGVTVATRNPWAGAAILGGISGGTAYEEGREEGLTPRQSLVFGATEGTVETATEVLSEKYLGRVIRSGGGFLKAIGVEAATEIPGEMVATALQGLNRWYWIDRAKGVSFQDFLNDMPDQQRSTIVATLTTVGLMGTGGYAFGRYIDQQVDQRSAASVDRLMEAAARSPTRTSNPTDFEEALNQLVGDTTAERLFIPAEQVQALFQEGRDIAEDPFWSAYAEQIEEAAALGGDVVVPLSSAATHLAGSPDWQALREHVRTRPGGASISEAQTQDPAELEKMAADIAERLDEKLPQLHAQRLTQNFAKTLGYEGEQAEAITRLVSAAMVRAHAVESAKRVSRGEAAPTLQEFAAGWMPEAAGVTQAEYEASIAEPSTVQDEGAPAEFDPEAHVESLRSLITGSNISLNNLNAIARKLGVTPEHANQVMGVVGSRPGAPFRMTKGRPARYRTQQMGGGKTRRVKVRDAVPPRFQRNPRSDRQMTAMEFVRSLGGVKSGRHDLRNLGGLSSHPGVINNKAGRQVDELGEALWEAGYINTVDRPTESEVLDFLDRASTQRTAGLEEQVDEQETFENDESEDRARADLDEALEAAGVEFTQGEKDHALYNYMAAGDSPAIAVVKTAHDAGAMALEEFFEATGKTEYANAAEDIYEGAIAEQRGDGTPEGDAGFGPDGPTEGGRGPSRAEPGETGYGQALNQLFDEPEQPKLTMTPEQRAEFEARLKQSMMRRGGQEALSDQEGGLFSAERDQDTLFQPAYHGSPHIFDRFSLDAIGTGEGAQAYGWGLYFAGRKEIAAYYRQSLAGFAKIHFNGQEIPSTTELSAETREWLADQLEAVDFQPEAAAGLSKEDLTRAYRQIGKFSLYRVLRQARDAAILGDDIPTALRKFADDQMRDAELRTGVGEGDAYSKNLRLESVLHAQMARAVAGQNLVSEVKPGRLYKVEIPDDGEYLLWDAPLAEQPEAVQTALAKAGIEIPPPPAPPADKEIAGIIQGALKFARKDRADIELTINNDSMLYNRGMLHAERAGVDTDDIDVGEYVVNRAKKYVEALEARELQTGERVYRNLVDEKGLLREGADRLASLALRDAGIAGIKYLDQGSRAAGDGSYNYVLFDDSRVSIEAYEQALRDSARGNISIQRDDNTLMTGAIIRAFESANFSTAVHELGHFFLEDLRRRALRGDATEQEQADWQAFKDWALNDLDGLLIADDTVIPVEAHEFWARGFERYVWEGNAPSTGLRAVFARMRDFMLSLYRAASSFNAPITPEIREVMDRLLASEDEINAQREELRLTSKAITDLMSVDERTAYMEMGDQARESARESLFNSVLSTLRAERTREVRDRKAEIKADVEAEIDGKPIFRALKLLRGGMPQEDGTVARVTLSRQWLVDAYGEDILGQMPRGVPPIVDDAHAMDADVIAEMTGFSSSDQMIRDLVDQEAERRRLKDQGEKRSPRRVLVEDITDQRLRDEMGDPFATLGEEAQAALANERQADRLSMELRAIARKAGRKPTAWKLASEWARRHVRAQSSRDAISGTAMQMYARNAAKAAQRVEEALVAQKFDEAFQAKQQQLLNMALMAQAKQAKDEIEKAVRRLQKIAGKATIATVDQDYLDQAHQLLEQVDMKTRPYSRDDKRLAFEAWHAQQVALGVEPVVPPEYRALLGQTNWARLKIEDLLELDKMVGQVIELGRLKQRLKDGKEERDFNEAVAELEAAAGGNLQRPRTRENDPNRSLGGRIKSRLRGIDAAMIKIEQMADWLDGDNPNGPWNRLLFRMASEAQGRENDLMRVYIKEINGLIKSLPRALVRQWDRSVDTPELIIRTPGHPQIGEPWQFRKDQIVMMAMNWGNEGNRQRLVDGFGWDEAQVEAALERLMTKEDWDFVQSVWNTIDKLWPEIEALERRVNGVAPEKIEAIEVQTPHGVYRGGYFPAVYDPSYSTRTELDEASKLAPNGAWHQATTRASATKARAERVRNRPLLLNMGVITRHLGEVIHDVSHREAVVQMRKILTDSRVRNAIDNALGPEYRKRMDAWVENIATPNAANSKSDPSMVGIARHLNKGISLTGLGYRISTALVQPLGMANMTSTLGEKAMLNGIRTFTASPRQVYNEIVERSAEMRSRFTTMDASIDEMAKEVAAGKLKVIGPGWITKHAFDGILYMDMLITSAGWIGAFNKGLAEGMNEEDATHYADKIVRTSQGAGGQKDRSAILYENQFARTFWPFFSYLNALYNQQRDIFHRARRAETAGDWADVARRSWWIFVVPTVLDAILLREGPEDDDDDGEVDGEEWAKYLTKAVVLGNFASIPGVGPIVNAIGTGYGYRSNAFQSIGEDIKRTYEGFERATEEDGQLTGSTIRGLLSAIGIITAKPLGQAGATAQGAYDIATGEAEPEDAGDVLETIMRGRPSPEPTAIERAMGETE